MVSWKHMRASADSWEPIDVCTSGFQALAKNISQLTRHPDKVYGFLEVVAKTGRSETNGNAGSSDAVGRPWEEVHKTLSDSMKERLDPFRAELSIQPHEMRGCFEECRFKARILSRTTIDNDPDRSTGMVTFDLQHSGITFQPGDRLAVMP